MGDKPRQKVQRGVSTVSQAPQRPAIQRLQSEAASRAAVQRALSRISSKSGGKDNPDGLTPELQWQQSTQSKASPVKKLLRVGGHIALIVMLAVYSAAGGALFVYFEGDNEIETYASVKQYINDSKREFADKVWNSTINNLTSIVDASVLEWFIQQNSTFKDIIIDELRIYDLKIYEAADAGVDVSEKNATYQWTYARSMFFSATVITTIGYGNIAPVTSGGRIFCIIYALFGIPLTLIAIADMGKMFADLIKFLYKRAKKKGLKKLIEPGSPEEAASLAAAASGPSKAKTSVKVFGSIGLLILYIALGSGLFLSWEDWSYLDSFYFCFITMTTIGLGDIVPEHQMYMLLCTIYILIGLALTSTCIELARSEYEKSFQKMLEASKRLQLQSLPGMSLVDTLRRIGDQIELHGEIIDLRLLHDLKTAIIGGKPEENNKPPPVIMYETSV